MKKAEKQIRETISKHSLIKKGDHVVIGLSGGPDSVCLFHVLLSLSEEMDLALYAVHLNHKFRPEAAERDQRYVEKLCDKYGVKERSFVVDCNELAAKTGMTSEEAGRKARYDAFFEMAMEVRRKLEAAGEGKVKIAVAQNAEDQAETVMFRLLRGSGTDGLAGIAYEREEKRDANSFKVIRPLLDTRREDIEDYCDENGLEPVIDHTNNLKVYARNRIRLELLPYIEANYNANIKEGLVRLARIAAADKDFFWEETSRRFDELRLYKDKAGRAFPENTVVLEREGLANCHEAIRHRVMLKAFKEIGLDRDITAERLEAADEIISKKQAKKAVEFPHKYLITVEKGRVYFENLRKNRGTC